MLQLRHDYIIISDYVSFSSGEVFAVNLIDIRLLSENKKSTVLLVRDSDTEQLYIRKTLSGKLPVYEALQECAHPYLPKIHEVQTSADKATVLEEYIDGTTLGAAELSEKRLRTAVLELCSVLIILHNKGIIHRDIKPSNIMVAPDGHIRLIDFDAARFTKRDSERDTEHLGTHGYAPPEQYGFAQTDARTDIFALGVTLEQLLGDKARKFRYRRVINKCKKLNPDKRFQSVRSVGLALRLPLHWLLGGAFILTVCALVLIISLLSPNITESPAPPVSDDATITHAPQPSATPTPTPTISTTQAPETSPVETTTPDETEATSETEPFEEEPTPPGLSTILPQTATYYSGELLLVSESPYVLMQPDDNGAYSYMRVDMTENGDYIDFVNPDSLTDFGYGEDKDLGFYLGELADEKQHTFWNKGNRVSMWPHAYEKIMRDIPLDPWVLVEDRPATRQITCVDADGDGIRELFVTCGNGADTTVTIVWRLSDTKEKKFEYAGYMWGTGITFLYANGDIRVGVNGDQLNHYNYSGGVLSSISELDFDGFKTKQEREALSDLWSNYEEYLVISGDWGEYIIGIAKDGYYLIGDAEDTLLTDDNVADLVPGYESIDELRTAIEAEHARMNPGG